MSGGIHLRIRRGTRAAFEAESSLQRPAELMLDVDIGGLGFRNHDNIRWFPFISSDQKFVLNSDQLMTGVDALEQSTLGISFAIPGEVQIVNLADNTPVARFTTNGAVFNSVSSGGVGATFGWRNYMINGSLQTVYNLADHGKAVVITSNGNVAPNWRAWKQAASPGNFSATVISISEPAMPGITKALRLLANNLTNGGVRHTLPNPKVSVGNQPLVYSYYVRSPTLGASFSSRVLQSGGVTLTQGHTILAANTWQRVSVPFTAELSPNPDRIDLDAVWAPSNAQFDITGVQIEIGTNVSSLELRPLAIEEMLCKSFYVADSLTLLAGQLHNLRTQIPMVGLPSIQTISVSPAGAPTYSNVTKEGLLIANSVLAGGTQYNLKIFGEVDLTTSETA